MPYYAEIISFFVVLFPAIDVVSAYPLYAHSLGNTIMSFVFNRLPVAGDTSRHDNSIIAGGDLELESNDINDEDDQSSHHSDRPSPLAWKYPVCFRLLAAIPPLLAAVIVQDLGMIIDYTGLAAFAIAFLFPAILAKYSEVRCNEQGVNAFTVYSGFFTAEVFRSMVILMASALISTVGFLLVYFQFI